MDKSTYNIGKRLNKRYGSVWLQKQQQQIRAWGYHHIYAFFFTLGKMLRTPIASLMTVVVIGTALSLPTGLLLTLDHIDQLTGSWQNSIQVSVFFKSDVTLSQAEEISRQWEENLEIERVTLISSTQALEEFKQLSGLTDLMSLLKKNPLPHTVIIVPKQDDNIDISLPFLQKKIQAQPEVDIVQLDMDWIRRLNAIITILFQVSLMLGALLSLAVLFTTGNTIRLHIENQRQEIEIIKLVGGTTAFIRRPFLYTGFWCGIGGGLIAWGIIGLAVDLLAGPVNYLANLYQSNFYLYGLGMNGFYLLSFSIALGLSGSWMSVARHLRKINPH